MVAFSQASSTAESAAKVSAAMSGGIAVVTCVNRRSSRLPARFAETHGRTSKLCAGHMGSPSRGVFSWAKLTTASCVEC